MTQEAIKCRGGLEPVQMATEGGPDQHRIRKGITRDDRSGLAREPDTVGDGALLGIVFRILTGEGGEDFKPLQPFQPGTAKKGLREPVGADDGNRLGS
jgi:hypothetical protein